ncbi:hypothetical protein SCA04_21730 [Staphylococcus carnosus]|nr:hypothetical protein SCA04_21730 [Staphylococcus carnosus]
MIENCLTVMSWEFVQAILNTMRDTILLGEYCDCNRVLSRFSLGSEGIISI